jgi:hypothetical protein
MTHTLDAATFWKLSALCERTAARAAAAAHARDALVVAQRNQNQCVADLAVTLGFDPTVEGFALDDTALTLTVPDQPGRPVITEADH